MKNFVRLPRRIAEALSEFCEDQRKCRHCPFYDRAVCQCELSIPETPDNWDLDAMAVKKGRGSC